LVFNVALNVRWISHVVERGRHGRRWRPALLTASCAGVLARRPRQPRQWRRHEGGARSPASGDFSRRPDERQLAIARSVVYASLFDYPLTLSQLRHTLIESIQTPSQVLTTYNGSATLQEAIEFRDGFFFPRGRADLVEERRLREARSRTFLRRHRLLLQLACALPGVRMVALSGSIAHLNLEGTGDLDLFIVTRGRRVWSTTVAVLILAKLMRRRRIVCANFVVADTRLVLEQQDLFAASQVIHLKPLIGRMSSSAARQESVRVPLLPQFPRGRRRIAAVQAGPRARLDEEPGDGAHRSPRSARLVCRSACRACADGRRPGGRPTRSAAGRLPEAARQSHRQSVLDRLEAGISDLRFKI
jgi:hypothetical protein